jgi:hypothetical protein
VIVGELFTVPVVIVPFALIHLPPDPELVLVTSPPKMLRFISEFRQTALYESVTPLAFLNVAPAPEVVTLITPELITKFPVLEIPLPPAPDATMVTILELISISLSA